MGGKTFAIARHGMGDFWKRYLLTRRPRRFVDGMCGMGSVAAYVAALDLGTEVHANDGHPAAVCLLRSVGAGWDPPDEMSEDEYRSIKERALASARDCAACQVRCWPAEHTCDGSRDPLVGFAGFGVSFGGKYFAGYGGRVRTRHRGKANPWSQVRCSANALRKIREPLSRVTFHVGDYRSLPERLGVLAGDCWYWDKPYTGTEQYRGVPGNGCLCGLCGKGKGGAVFCDTAFWQRQDALAKTPGVDVLVSEFLAPAHWRKLWSTVRRQEMRDGQNGSGQAPKEDCVFVREHTYNAIMAAASAAGVQL